MFIFVGLDYTGLSVARKQGENAQLDGCGMVSLEALTDDARLCLAPSDAVSEGSDEVLHIPMKAPDLLFSKYPINSYLSFLLCFWADF